MTAALKSSAVEFMRRRRSALFETVDLRDMRVVPRGEQFASRLAQQTILLVGLLQDRDVRVGVFP
jgi:hypothetical protein